jgi:hypothetical protein
MALPGFISGDDDRHEIERQMLEVPQVRDWFVPASGAEPGSLDLRIAYARATRKLGNEGKRPLCSVVPEVSHVGAHWTLLDGARWLLCRRALGVLDQGSGAAFVHDLFLGGEQGEQVSLLRTLCALPAPERFLPTAVEACRSNSVAVFQAIACENPYPAACFPELAWNQMVIKAIFLEVPVERIVRLVTRISADLVRMAEGLASERRAAGRSVPSDIDFIVTRSRQA